MSIRQSFIDRLYKGTDPFASYEKPKTVIDKLPEGWGSTHPYFKQYIDLIRPSLIVEVGTWLGGSAINMGHLLRAAGLKESCIICVDTWLGSSEHFLYPEQPNVLKLVNGRANIYDDFMRNVLDHGLQDNILPFSITSIAAAEVFRECKFVPDLIYLDGDHTSRGFRADLDLYWEILRPGGAIIGDDFDWEGVQWNVINFAYLQQVEFTSFSNKFLIRKPG